LTYKLENFAKISGFHQNCLFSLDLLLLNFCLIVPSVDNLWNKSVFEKNEKKIHANIINSVYSNHNSSHFST